MSTPNGTPSKRARNENAGPQTPQQNDPITPSRRTRAGSQQTPSQQRTPSRSRKYSFSSHFSGGKISFVYIYISLYGRIVHNV